MRERSAGITLLSVCLLLITGCALMASPFKATNAEEPEFPPVAELREALQGEPKYPNLTLAYFDVGVARARQGRLAEAIVELRHATSLNWSSAELHFILGNTLHDQGSLDAAIAEYREAIGFKPNFAVAYTNLGRALSEQGKLDEAMIPLRTAIRIDPNLAEARVNLALALARQGKPEAAIREYREAIRISPNFARAHYHLGLALAAQGKLDAAIAEFREAIRLRPKVAVAHSNLGLGLAGQFEREAAIAEFREAVRLDPNLPVAHSKLGLAFASQGKLDEAIAAFSTALAIDPQNKYFMAHLGWLYVQSGQTDRGLHLLTQAPIEPFYFSELLFPNAKDADQRREYFLNTLAKMDERLDNTTLILAHIFTHHISKEKIIDPHLIQSLESIAKDTASPLYYDALTALYADIQDWPNFATSAEAAIRQIETRQFDIKDKEHLSHYYYNSAGGYSRIGDYEKAKQRLKQAFSIDKDLYSWGLQDPGLKGLRNHLGVENYESVFGPPPQG